MAEVMAAAGGMAVTLVRPLAAAADASGVILYMDAFGPRPALVAMAERIASWGHVVLVPDLFYRFGAYGPFDPATGFSDPTVRGQLIGMIGATSQDMTVQDTGVLLGMLAEAGATGPTGTVGYCLGGGRALTAAAAYPDRIKATASFHGGNLAMISRTVRICASARSVAWFMSAVLRRTAAFRPSSPPSLSRPCGARSWIT